MNHTELVKAQSVETLMQSLRHLEDIAPEPWSPDMPVWCRMTGWVEDELVERLGCADEHTEWVLSDDFGNDEFRTSYPFFSRIVNA